MLCSLCWSKCRWEVAFKRLHEIGSTDILQRIRKQRLFSLKKKKKRFICFWCTMLYKVNVLRLGFSSIWQVTYLYMTTVACCSWGPSPIKVQLHSAGAFAPELSKWGSAADFPSSNHCKEYPMTCKEKCLHIIGHSLQSQASPPFLQYTLEQMPLPLVNQHYWLLEKVLVQG